MWFFIFSSNIFWEYIIPLKGNAISKENTFHAYILVNPSILTHIWAMTRDFKQSGILAGVDSDEHVQHPIKLSNSKWYSASSLTVI